MQSYEYLIQLLMTLMMTLMMLLDSLPLMIADICVSYLNSHAQGYHQHLMHVRENSSTKVGCRSWEPQQQLKDDVAVGDWSTCRFY